MANFVLLEFWEDRGRFSVLRAALGVEQNGIQRISYAYDIIGILDANGNIVAKYTYDEWGNILSITDSNNNAIINGGHVAHKNPLRYRGYYYDDETGFYYLQSRYYDPVTGRFINADGLISTGQGILGNNMFAYCGNNPINRADYTGTIGVWAIIGIGTLIISMAVCLNASDSNTTALIAERKKEAANKKYNEENVNVFITGSGVIEKDKVNVELMPDHKDPKTQESNPNILIHDSYKIRNVYEQIRIMEIVINSSIYDNSTFTRSLNSYITEWRAHNVLYDATFFSSYLRERFGSADLDENEVIAWDIEWQ